jgi:hypothetical protein
MLGTAWLGAGFITFVNPPSFAEDRTALDRYLGLPDPNYRYDLISTIPGYQCTAYVLEMTSQQWRTTVDVDRPIWKHWLTIVEPQQVRTNRPPPHQRRLEQQQSTGADQSAHCVSGQEHGLGDQRAAYGTKPAADIRRRDATTIRGRDHRL